MTKIYTKTGDKGKTTVCGGKRIWKDSPRIETLGAIDELNSALGACRVFIKLSKLQNIILDIQNDIFIIQAQISGFDKKIKTYKIKNIEKLIDKLSRYLEFDGFVIPGETKESALFDFARAICRRAERRIVRFQREQDKFPNKNVRNSVSNIEMLKYLNRLSDLLYVMARYVNKNKKEKSPKY